MITTFFIRFEIGFQKVWEKEKFEDYKHHKQLDYNNQPYLPAPLTHISKPIVIQVPGT